MTRQQPITYLVLSFAEPIHMHGNINVFFYCNITRNILYIYNIIFEILAIHDGAACKVCRDG